MPSAVRTVSHPSITAQLPLPCSVWIKFQITDFRVAIYFRIRLYKGMSALAKTLMAMSDDRNISDGIVAVQLGRSNVQIGILERLAAQAFWRVLWRKRFCWPID